jgi:ligand-binding sensor domain-containing protein/signal transduction histidine kinase/DNA-binding response OmpR family regulator
MEFLKVFSKIKWFLICVVFLVQCVFSECSLSAEIAISTPVEPIAKFRNINVDDGLSQGTVYSVMQDNAGVVWLATQDGLNKFDGHKFTVYQKDASASQLSNNFTTELLQDKNGDIWIGTIYGLNRYSPSLDVWGHYFHSEKASSIPENNIKKLFMDSDGVMWIGTKNGVAYYDSVSDKFVPMLTSVGNGHSLNVDEIIQHPSGDLLFGSNDGVYYLNKATGAYRFYPVEDASVSLIVNTMEVIDRNQNIVLLGTNRGIYVLTLADGTVTRWDIFNFLNSERVYDFYQENGHVFVATSAGFHCLGLEDGSIFRKSYYNDMADVNSLSSNHVLSIYKDKDDTLWLGTLNGVSLFNKKMQLFNHFSARGEVGGVVAKGEVFALFGDRQGDLWVGTSSGMSVFDSELKTHKVFSGVTGRVSAFAEDSSGNLWVGGAKGVFHYDMKIGAIVPVDRDVDGTQFLDGAVVFSLLLDRHESLWIGSGWGLHRYSIQSKKVTHYFYDKNMQTSLSDNQIYSLYEGLDGNIWVGTLNGLNMLDPTTGIIKRFFPDRSDEQQQLFWVFSIVSDGGSGLWLATTDGLYWFDLTLKKFKRFGKERGLYNENLFGIVIGDKNNVWVSTNNGLAKFDAKREVFDVYRASVGLQNQEFNFGAYAKLQDGRMAFGGINGINIFREEDVAILQDAGPVAPILTNVTLLDNKNTYKDATGKADLSARKNADPVLVEWSDTLLSVEFSALNYLFSKDVTYRYKLNGYDSDWIYVPSGQNHAIYTNLDSGRYIFEVQSRIGSGYWSHSHNRDILVSSPPWKGPLAYFIYAALPLLIFFLFLWRKNLAIKNLRVKIFDATSTISQQKRALEFANKDLEYAIHAKENFYKQLTHELKTPLTLIKLPLDLLLSNVHELQFRHWLNIIKHHSAELANMVDSLLALSSAQQKGQDCSIGADIKIVCEELVGHFSALAIKNNISLSFRCENNYIVACSTAELKVMLNNLLTNAIKYTGKGGFVVVQVIELQGMINVCVRDSGFGISEFDQKNLFKDFVRGTDPRIDGISGTGLGLVLVKNLVEKVSGTICVESVLNKGSAFTLSLPLLEADVTFHPPLEVCDSNIVLPEYNGDSFLILVVEDNPDINALICQLFSEKHTCIAAYSFDESIKLLSQHVPDLVITDLMLSDYQAVSAGAKGGIELCQLIKTTEGMSHIPVIMLTALGQKNNQLYGLSQGADDYICKPFDTRDVLLRVNNRLQQLTNSKRYFGDRTRGITRSEKSTAESPYFSELGNMLKIEFENNFNNPEYSINHLAKVVSKTPRTLQLYFKKMDTTFGVLLLEFRLHKAREKIKQGNAIGLVAAECGINDPSRFSKEYKKKFGVLPSDEKPKTH